MVTSGAGCGALRRASVGLGRGLAAGDGVIVVFVTLAILSVAITRVAVWAGPVILVVNRPVASARASATALGWVSANARSGFRGLAGIAAALASCGEWWWMMVGGSEWWRVAQGVACVGGWCLWFRVVASVGELWQVVAIGASSVRLWRMVAGMGWGGDGLR